MKKQTSKTQKLKKIIEQEVIVTKDTHKIVSARGEKSNWLFDFRSILLEPDYIDLIAEIFWDRYKMQYPFQVGGLETAAIPIITAIVLKGNQLGKPVSGFYVRKSRNKRGLLKLVEGQMNDYPIILVDDLINSGSSLTKQIEVLKQLDRTVSEIFTLV